MPIICIWKFVHYFEVPIPFKANNQMKTIAKKLSAVNPVLLLRNLALSIAFIAFLVITLYVLINSPA